MKLKHFLIPMILLLLLLFCLLFSVILLSEDDSDSGDNTNISNGTSGLSVSEKVLAYSGLVTKYATEDGIQDYVNYLLAIMQIETGGVGDDVMQCSESLNLPKNSLKPEESIKQACVYFSGLLTKAKATGCDMNTVVQAYNYNGGYIDYVAAHSDKHAYTFELAQEYAKDKSSGKVITYTDPIAVQTNGGWRYNYGNMFYVQLVSQYLFLPQLSDDTTKAVFAEALKYQGWKYIFGGYNPNTSFDCSGLTQWCYGKAGITLPRTAQEQYDLTQHISIQDAKPGDLIFFTGTYDSGTYISHVGIYAGDNKMYHAGDPIGYTDLTTSYWQSHLVSAGRIKK
jgi:cell wall-associated NlpC family hydrolase